MHGDLAGLGLEDFALDTYDIAHIILFEIRIGLFSDAVSCHIYLDVAGQILYITEGCLTHDTFGHYTSGDTDGLAFQFFEIVLDIGAVMGHIIFGDLKRILACLLQVSQLLALYLKQLMNILLLYICVLCICHFFPLLTLSYLLNVTSLDLQNLICEYTCGCLYFYGIADLMADQCLTYGALVGYLAL